MRTRKSIRTMLPLWSVSMIVLSLQQIPRLSYGRGTTLYCVLMHRDGLSTGSCTGQA
jgi:hypothetical protein